FDRSFGRPDDPVQPAFRIVFPAGDAGPLGNVLRPGSLRAAAPLAWSAGPARRRAGRRRGLLGGHGASPYSAAAGAAAGVSGASSSSGNGSPVAASKRARNSRL